MASTFRARGHKLMMSDPSSLVKITGDSPITPSEASQQFGYNVSSYCGNEIYENPPDVIIVGRIDNQEKCFELFGRLSNIKPVIILSMSGTFQSHFHWEAYDGHICCDLASRILARFNNRPAIRYLEASSLDEYSFIEMPSQDKFNLRSFINGMDWRFPLSSSFHNECRIALADYFGDRVQVENMTGLPHASVREYMINSAMTLHIKDEEGYGWSVVESLFTGRPIIYQSGLSKDMAFLDWIEPGVTGFGIQTPQDLVQLVSKFIDDPAGLRRIQQKTAEVVRLRYDGQVVAEDMVCFVEDLHRLARMRWLPHRPRAPFRLPAPYQPTLNPDEKQDFEKLWDESRSQNS